MTRGRFFHERSNLPVLCLPNLACVICHEILVLFAVDNTVFPYLSNQSTDHYDIFNGCYLCKIKENL